MIATRKNKLFFLWENPLSTQDYFQWNNFENTFGRMAEDLNQWSLVSEKYEEYVTWQKYLCWQDNQMNL